MLLLPLPNSRAGVLIKNAKIVSNGVVLDPTDILCDQGKILKVGKIGRSGRHKVFDARDMFALPGLIDAHAHITTVPGALFRKDSAEKIAELQKLQLASYLTAGVTTVMDPAISWQTFRKLRDHVTKTGLGPRIVPVVPAIGPSEGYIASMKSKRKKPFADFWAPADSESDIEKYLRFSKARKSLGVKLAVEDGFGPVARYKLYSEQQHQFIADKAKELDVKLFVHSMTNDEHLMALSLKPYALVHAGYFEEEPAEGVLDRILADNVYVITTLAIHDMAKLLWDGKELEDPLFKILIPPEQLASLGKPEVVNHVGKETVMENKPKWAPAMVAMWFKGRLFNNERFAEFLVSSKKAVKKMFDKGIKLIMGSDAGNWPIFVSFFHGYGSIREIELLMEAGIPAADVIKMSTTSSAEMLRRQHAIGAIEAGKKADLILLSKNPLQEPKAFRSLSAVMKAGVIKTPKGWMDEARKVLGVVQ